MFKKVPNSILQFTQLTKIDLSFNQIKSLGALKSHPTLKYIDIQNNNVRRLVFDHYENALNLTHLDITDNYIDAPVDSTQTFLYSFPSVYNQKNPTLIVPYLFLGAVNATKDPAFLKTIGIAAILSLGKKPFVESDIQNLFIPIDDSPSTDLLKIVRECITFINDFVIKKKGVLVHCEFGISRSASVIIAYLMKKNKMTYKEALKFVTNKRMCVLPNKGFETQLGQFEKEQFIFTEIKKKK
ncbi:dual specificity protein phosphatase, putative [Entamoeba invadens IP1]|uniref:protein-tyrosine-phosphatase n=1 Tax=Entamoeba invadens IP1 TaxID=370355 RepID=A0A0A1U490_ENTIV|nr:dual specificity protein phosphatase, putative [Entamoeba invadens IP1]ELP87533.1 dual specificity protein phosphatase, putative [Entamoeba invadens IP1]|eukprot:XP_004254304.1 dual specificity protein phosphatase, putative [Entamoeba invadens IP1]